MDPATGLLDILESATLVIMPFADGIVGCPGGVTDTADGLVFLVHLLHPMVDDLIALLALALESRGRFLVVHDGFRDDTKDAVIDGQEVLANLILGDVLRCQETNLGSESRRRLADHTEHHSGVLDLLLDVAGVPAGDASVSIRLGQAEGVCTDDADRCRVHAERRAAVMAISEQDVLLQNVLIGDLDILWQADQGEDHLATEQRSGRLDGHAMICLDQGVGEFGEFDIADRLVTSANDGEEFFRVRTDMGHVRRKLELFLLAIVTLICREDRQQFRLPVDPERFKCRDRLHSGWNLNTEAMPGHLTILANLTELIGRFDTVAHFLSFHFEVLFFTTPKVYATGAT